MFKEFKAFVLRGNVVDLAVGVVIGAAFSGIINGLVTGLLNPLIALFGDASLERLSFGIGSKVVEGDTVPQAVFQYGLVLDAIVNFLLIAAAVFFFVVKPLNHLMAKVKPEQPVDKPTQECPECLSSIPVGARRCSFCTAQLVAG